jgi:hypothetical protein
VFEVALKVRCMKASFRAAGSICLSVGTYFPSKTRSDLTVQDGGIPRRKYAAEGGIPGRRTARGHNTVGAVRSVVAIKFQWDVFVSVGVTVIWINTILRFIIRVVTKHAAWLDGNMSVELKVERRLGRRAHRR